MYRSSTPPLEEIVRSALSTARTRDGRLVRITLSVPEGTAHDDITSWVRDRLAARGVEGVEVQAVPGPGPVKVLRLEFAR